jgi:hypothetical protein
MLTLPEIKAEVDRRASTIGASRDSSLPTYGRTEDCGQAHIEVDEVNYHFVIVERGKENTRVSTPDLDHLLYLVFECVTFSLAGQYEVNHRVQTQDCRRIMFQRQIELLSQLSSSWGGRCAQRLDFILRKHPYDDFVMIRVDFTMALRKQGHAPDIAWRLACERYPLPGDESSA